MNVYLTGNNSKADATPPGRQREEMLNKIHIIEKEYYRSRPKNLSAKLKSRWVKRSGLIGGFVNKMIPEIDVLHRYTS